MLHKWECPVCSCQDKPYDRSKELSPTTVGFCCKNFNCRYVGHKIEFMIGKHYKSIRIK